MITFDKSKGLSVEKANNPFYITYHNEEVLFICVVFDVNNMDF